MGIWTKVADDGGKWVEIGASSGGGELPGLGGWATITAVSGDYKNPRHEYNDGVTDWVAYEWTDDGTLTTTDGLLDMLLVSGGGAGSSNSTHSVYGTCGRVEQGINYLSGTQHDVKVGAGGQWAVMNGRSYPSSCGPHAATFVGYGQPTYGSGATDPSVDINPAGIRSSITGPDTEYAPGNTASSTHGHVVGQPGRDTDRNGFRGVVIVRVPAANAQSVAENFHGWDSFALVTDGVVTEVTKVPDNEPHTLDAEWLPCAAEVQPGWSHADGEFTPPPAPTRDDLIAELKERIKDLQKDK